MVPPLKRGMVLHLKGKRIRKLDDARYIAGGPAPYSFATGFNLREVPAPR